MCHSAVAHQQKLANTNVLFNERTGQIEISHRLYVHDAEHAIKAIAKEDYDLYSQATARTKLANYVADRFSVVLGEASSSTDAKLVGSETEGNFFWVYQVMPIPESFLQGDDLDITISNNILMDMIPSQTNMVYVEYLSFFKTLVFKHDDNSQAVRVEHSTETP
jgi:hypothetical protein